MTTLSKSFYQKIFFWGAVWNFSVALPGLLFYKLQFGQTFGPESFTGNFHLTLLFIIFMLAVLIFGIGYYIVSIDPFLNRGIVWMGIMGKLCLFCILTFCFIVGKATLIAFMLVLGDVIWSVLFGLFLYQTREGVKLNQFVG
jgi:hypothetical protein